MDEPLSRGLQTIASTPVLGVDDTGLVISGESTTMSCGPKNVGVSSGLP